jgi:hypothetical protein
MSSTMRDKILKILVYLAGILCGYCFLATRIEPMFNAILKEKLLDGYWENVKYGELYYFNLISHFREEGLPKCKVKYRFTSKCPSVQNADILAFGDSFFDFSRMTTYPEQLSDSLHKKVFYARMDRPLEYLAEHHYQNTEKKYLIYETAERFLHERFITPQPTELAIDNRSWIRKKIADFRDKYVFLNNTEILYNVILTRSYLTTDIYSLISTIKFDLFHIITSQTPVYKLNYDNRPWLFGGLQFGDGPQGYYYSHTNEEIENYCENIEKLSIELKERYNLELIFMIIPSKFTVYHFIIGVQDSQYGNFMPKMYAELEKRGIPVIKIYDEFMAQRKDKLLYYGTDTHWTEEGLHIALNKTLSMIDSLDNKNIASENRPTFYLTQK